MARWTKDEIAAAFEHYREQVRRAGESGDWNLFADLFTEDATYVEHLYGEFHGREQIRDWIVRTMTTEPGCWMPWFPPTWWIVDEDRDRIVCEIGNRMQDPGDGSVHQATNITILDYAGDQRWSREEDVYNPAKFTDMLQGWARVALEHERLPGGAEEWFDAAMPGWRG